MKMSKSNINSAVNVNVNESSSNNTSSKSDSLNSPFALSVEVRSCVNKRLVEAFTAFAQESAKKLGFTITSGPSVQPPEISRWTVLSSPFVHKTARTQFERREHATRLRFDGIWREEICAKFVWYLKRHVPNEVELDLNVIERVPLKAL